MNDALPTACTRMSATHGWVLVAMSEQRFSNAFREALWEAHLRKCLYCRKDIAFVEMKVDHVIPESAQKDYKRLLEVRKGLGLGSEFSILGFENLAPSCDD